MFKFFIIFAILNYFIGSVENALIIGKLIYKTDVRNFGSGNLGATNTGRVLGKKAAYAVAILDGLKGFICFVIESKINYEAAFIASIFVAIGHCFPFFAGFRGGKAVATTFGIILAISLKSLTLFIGLFIVPLVIWALIAKFTQYVSLASLIGIFSSLIISLFIQEDMIVCFTLFVLLIIVVIRLSSNIDRLVKGNENKKNY